MGVLSPSIEMASVAGRDQRLRRIGLFSGQTQPAPSGTGLIMAAAIGLSTDKTPDVAGA
jgi:hypothetical protein